MNISAINKLKLTGEEIRHIRNNIALTISADKNNEFSNGIRRFYDISGRKPVWIGTKKTRKINTDTIDLTGKKRKSVLWEKFTTTMPKKDEIFIKTKEINRFYDLHTKEKFLERTFDKQFVKDYVPNSILEKKNNILGNYKKTRSSGKIENFEYGLTFIQKEDGTNVYMVQGKPVSKQRYSDITSKIRFFS